MSLPDVQLEKPTMKQEYLALLDLVGAFRRGRIVSSRILLICGVSLWCWQAGELHATAQLPPDQAEPTTTGAVSDVNAAQSNAKAVAGAAQALEKKLAAREQ